MSAKRSTPSVETHRWEFKARFRRHAFGWRSQPAITRIKQAVAEIKKVAKKDPALAAEGRHRVARRRDTNRYDFDGRTTLDRLE